MCSLLKPSLTFISITAMRSSPFQILISGFKALCPFFSFRILTYDFTSTSHLFLKNAFIKNKQVSVKKSAEDVTVFRPITSLL